jgi:hypothetical protein
MILLDKVYDGESIVDAERDVCEAFDARFTPDVRYIPVDENHIQKGTFKIRIEWIPE